ncbi:MAG: hypothetical protein E6G02_02740 [Actinobacteria bacterium]|nr:MAG: hypothetical protein E6G02_02740 [Actinomycetota bacterium]
MEVIGVLQMLDEAGAEADVRPALALLAAPEPLVEPDELTPALRRAMLLLAAGGDPHRELELDGRAVSALAAGWRASARKQPASPTSPPRWRSSCSTPASPGTPTLARSSPTNSKTTNRRA